MKTQCPHCHFKFDTNENLNPPLKIGDRVKFIKRHKWDYWKCTGPEPKTGKITNYYLSRAGNHCVDIDKFNKKDLWFFEVATVLYGNRNGITYQKEIPQYAIKKIKK